MDRTSISRRIGSIKGDIEKLSNTLCAIEKTDIENYPENYAMLTTDAALRSELIACRIECPYGRTDCGGHLLTADAEGTPLLLPVLLFEKMTGDKVDKFECAAIIAKEAFEKLFHSWLVWNVTDPNTCSILQAILEDQGT